MSSTFPLWPLSARRTAVHSVASAKFLGIRIDGRIPAAGTKTGPLPKSLVFSKFPSSRRAKAGQVTANPVFQALVMQAGISTT
jgi:hypothetical protein